MDLIDQALNTEFVWDDDIVQFRYDQYYKTVKDLTKSGFKPNHCKFKQGYFLPVKGKLKEKSDIIAASRCLNIMNTEEPSPICFRSGWEKVWMEYCWEKSKNEKGPLLLWGSEVLKVLYPNPLTKKMSFYVVDGFMRYLDMNKKIHNMLVEIKPENQTFVSEAKSAVDKIQFGINQLKWASAVQYAKKRNMEFRILTNRDFGC